MRRILISALGIAVAAALLASLWGQAAEPVTVRTVDYGEANLKADIYEAANSPATRSRPAILMIHGGGWGAGSRTEFKEFAKWLAQQGMVPILIDYRLTTSGAHWPAQAQDVEQAVWAIRENAEALHVAPDKIVALGGSAGGHLAAWLGTTDHKNARGTSSRANLVISLWGPWDLTVTELRTDAKNMIASLMQGENPRQASPYFFIDGHSAPSLLIHGTKDTLVPPDQSIRACAALNAAKARCELLLLEGENHSLAANPDHPALVASTIKRYIETNLR
jgi:acetyl esterase